MVNDKKLISIVVPVLDEHENIAPLYRALNDACEPLTGRYDFEYVFTDNRSSDGTFEAIQLLATQDPRVKGYRFSKNFGFQRSILTGYQKAAGAAVIQIDADLQDPPELIPQFVAKWEAGYDVVYGIRRRRPEGRLLGWGRKGFYWLIDRLSDDDLPRDAGDFRLVSRRVVDVVTQVDDYHPYLRGLIASVGFDQIGIEYDRNPRAAGESKFSIARLVGLAFDGILVQSVVPLRIATFVGVFMAILMVLAIVWYAVSRVFFGQEWPPGFTTTTILLLLGIALNGLFLGIIGEYLGRLYQQSKRRPISIIDVTTADATASDVNEANRHG